MWTKISYLSPTAGGDIVLWGINYTGVAIRALYDGSVRAGVQGSQSEK